MAIFVNTKLRVYNVISLGYESLKMYLARGVETLNMDTRDYDKSINATFMPLIWLGSRYPFTSTC